jgi:hypothetical protein
MEASKTFLHGGKLYQPGDTVNPVSDEAGAQLKRNGLVDAPDSAAPVRDPATGSWADPGAIQAARERAAAMPAGSGRVDATFAAEEVKRQDDAVARISEADAAQPGDAGGRRRGRQGRAGPPYRGSAGPPYSGQGISPPRRNTGERCATGC